MADKKTITTTLVRAFEPQSGAGKNGKPWTRCDFQAEGDLKFSTFRGEVASVAKALVGQPVVVEFTEEQNGQYTNRTLVSVSAAGNGNGNTPGQTAGPEQNIAPNPTGPFPSEQERQLRIMRQSGLDRALTAFGIAGQDPLGSLEELYELSDEFINYFVNGRVPSEVEA